jgi:Kef-type K+ transport system membrane component KefB
MPERRARRRRIRSEAQALAFLFLLFGVVLVTSVATGSLLALGAFVGGVVLAILHEALRDPP